VKRPIRQNNTEIKHKPSNFIPRYFIWISLISCVIICAYFATQEQIYRFPITTVKIDGQVLRTSKQEIWNATVTLLKKGFFVTDVMAIKANLQNLPWVETAAVEKIWPDKLHITIKERLPIARWRGKGLVTTAGDIVYTDLLGDSNKLPVFWGSDLQVKNMLESYLTISDVLKRNEMSVSEIEIMPDQGLRAILNNGIMLFLGSEGLLERINRFTLAYRNKLQKISYKIDYVDLRYVNGIAVGWKDNISEIQLDYVLDEDYKINV
jgi:cell division protein FtsQ